MIEPVIPTVNILFMFVTVAVTLLFPILLWIIFARKARGVTVAVLAGTVGFILPQMIIRLPILQLLSASAGWVAFNQNNVVLSAFIYAFSAALFETTGRLLVLGAILRKRLSYYTAVGAGIGHGGIEAIGLVGLTYVSNIVLSLMANTGTLPNVAGIDTAVGALSGTAPALFLLAGAERVFTIPFHMMLSVILCLFLMKRKALAGILICIAVHTAVDFVIPLLSTGISVYLVEGILLVVALVSVFVIRAAKKHFPVIEIPKDPAQIAVEEGY